MTVGGSIFLLRMFLLIYFLFNFSKSRKFHSALRMHTYLYEKAIKTLTTGLCPGLSL